MPDCLRSASSYTGRTMMMLAGIVVTSSLKRARLFLLKLIFTLLFSVGVWLALLLALPSTHFTYEYLRYFLLFLCTLIGIYTCYDVSLGKTLFCGIATYAIQHLVVKLYTLAFFAYGVFVRQSESWIDIEHFAAYWLILAVVYTVLYFFLGRKLKISAYDFSTKTQLATVVLLLFVTLFLSSTFDMSDTIYLNTICFLLCDALCAGLIVMIQLHAYGLSQKELEMIEAESLHRMELRQMRQTKEMMELINIKSHDLKHQLIAANGKLNESEAAEIASAVYSYDSSVHTGSEALDLAVSQKKMMCEREGIPFTYMLNGELLSFMSDTNIYSLVGNMLDNAIEAVKGLPKESRYIVFEVKEVAGMILIQTENEYIGNLNWRNGELQTSKDDENYHGFGMKSIASITRKYGGHMSVTAEDGVFVLTISFTLEKRA